MNNSKDYDNKMNEKSEFADFSEEKLKLILEGLEKRISTKLENIEKQVDEISDQIYRKDFSSIDDVSEKEIKLETQLRYANEALHQYRSTLDQVYQSTSWKITAPVRLLGARTRKLKKFLQLFNQLRKKHSLIFLLKKSFQVLSQDGLQGFINQLKQQNAIQAAQSGVLVSNSFLQEPAFIHRDKQGKFSLNSTPNSYVYIEPERNELIDAKMASWQKKPLFSIVVPLYNTTQELLDGVIKSVEGQWYSNWELVLVDDCSPDPATRKALEKITNPQIKIFYSEVNQGISGATNIGLQKASGDFIVFMDHDDEITADCLYELALCIERDDPDFVYSDEDKLTEDGSYIDPHFKPDWSPDTMMSTMFTGHVSCVRSALLEKVGMLRPEFNGCQDWDFVLRVSEITKKISHIPKVLYHWRIIPGSTAANIAAKSYVLEASQNARKDALKRRGKRGSVEAVEQVPGYFRVNYHLEGSPKFSIIIPSRDNFSVLRKCVESIFDKTEYKDYEIILVDNGSRDKSTLDYIESLKGNPRISVVSHDIPFNYSELNNVGVKKSQGDILVFLNDDVEILQGDWLNRMGGYAQLSHIGAVGAKLLYPGETLVQHSGVINLENGPAHALIRCERNQPGYYMRNLIEYNYFAVTGACLMIERDKYCSVGGFEERLPVAYNDVDLCAKLLKSGFYNVVCQGVRLIHHESLSRGHDAIDPVKQNRLKKDLRLFYSLNPEFYQYDPFHNLNFQSNSVNFALGY